MDGNNEESSKSLVMGVIVAVLTVAVLAVASYLIFDNINENGIDANIDSTDQVEEDTMSRGTGLRRDNQQRMDSLYQNVPDNLNISLSNSGSSPDTAYYTTSGNFIFNETGHLREVEYDDQAEWDSVQVWLDDHDFSFWGYEFPYGPSSVIESYEDGKPRVISFYADEVYMTTSSGQVQTEVGLD